MKKSELLTPAILVDEDRLQGNIRDFQRMADAHGKQLVPMTKTHKSTEIARMQMNAGTSDFLVGTILEAEKFAELGPNSITFSYPFAGRKNLERIAAIAEKTQVYVSLDSMDTAEIYGEFCREKGIDFDFFVLINVGLNRFGIGPDELVPLLETVKDRYPGLHFAGISTHPGQVYGVNGPEYVGKVCADSDEIMRRARENAETAGFACRYVATGSTPTYEHDVDSDVYTTLRPGNYVFFDTMQTVLGAHQSRCALTVYATVISRHGDRKWLIDAGSKCFGLDKGAHGNSSITGYGQVIGYPDMVVDGLSEEVGIIVSENPHDLKTGDRLEIIPNHSCSVANMTSYLVLTKGDEVIGSLKVDARENTADPLKL